jgi:hypothetical protein
MSKPILHGDSWWYRKTGVEEAPIVFIRYTWRHRIRLLIGIDGYMGDGEYVFRRGRVRFRGRLHYFLNHWLSAKHPRLNPKKWI